MAVRDNHIPHGKVSYLQGRSVVIAVFPEQQIKTYYRESAITVEESRFSTQLNTA